MTGLIGAVLLDFTIYIMMYRLSVAMVTAIMAEKNAAAQEIDKGDFKDYYEKYLAPSSIFAMEYIPIGNIRTDPVVTQVCLSDHVHTFYGENGEYLNVLA